jgi:hypothetical protein
MSVIISDVLSIHKRSPVVAVIFLFIISTLGIGVSQKSAYFDFLFYFFGHSYPDSLS